MTNKAIKSVCKILVWGAVLFIVIFARIGWFDAHFTHYDDINVPKFVDYTIDHFGVVLSGLKQAGSVGSMLAAVLNTVLGAPVNAILTAIQFSRIWTYAPGQFVLTFLLLPLADSYESIKFWGRLPSLLAGLLALFVLWKVAKKYFDKPSAGLLGICVLGCSWQSILYCMHMSNYEVIILLGLLAALMLASVSNEEFRQNRWLLFAAAAGVMTWFHYQAAVYFAGLLLVCLAWGIIRRRPITRTFFTLIFCGALYAAIVVPVFLLNLQMGAGITWNAGPNGEYVYKTSLDILELARFFITNTYVVTKAMLSPVSLSSPLADVFCVAYLLLFTLGVTSALLRRGKSEKNFFLAVFILGSFAAEYFLVFLGAFSLSPSRHSNVLIPLLVMGVMQGFDFLLSLIAKISLRGWSALAASFLVCACFVRDFHPIMTERRDQFSTQMFEQLLRQYQPDIIVGYNAPQVYYLTNDRDFSNKQKIDYRTEFFPANDKKPGQIQSVMVISHHAALPDETMTLLFDQLYQANDLTIDEYERLRVSLAVVKEERWGALDFDFQNLYTLGTNGLFVYLYQF